MGTQPSLAATKRVRIAVDAALLARPALAAMAGGWTNGRPPQGTPTPYGVYSNPSQGDWGVVDQAGAEGTLMLHVFDPDPDLVDDLLGEVIHAIHDVPLAAEGLEHLLGSVTVLDISADPDTPDLYHGVAAYRWQALAQGVTA